MKSTIWAVCVLFAITVAAGPAAAAEPEEVPSLINYQGRLSGSDGIPLSGNYTLRFSFYSDPVTGTLLWQESQNVTLVGGKFNVMLGAVTPITSAMFQSANAYLSLRVNNDPEMMPRSRIASVGYAFRAQDAATVNGLRANEISAGGTVEGVTFHKASDIASATTTCEALVDIPEGARFALLYESYTSGITNVKFYKGDLGVAQTPCQPQNIVAESLTKSSVGLVFSGNQRIWWKADNTGTYKATISGEIRY